MTEAMFIVMMSPRFFAISFAVLPSPIFSTEALIAKILERIERCIDGTTRTVRKSMIGVLLARYGYSAGAWILDGYRRASFA